jgi:hypothetical protein
MILALENPPWDSLYRAVIGWFLMPAYLRLAGTDAAHWIIFAFFLAVLAALRVVPGLLRRVLPFSRELKSVWAERRALAKRYDSYQWRKLFGLGLGWLAFLVVAGLAQGVPLLLAVASLVAGALGLAFWHQRSKVLAAQAGPAAPAATAPA